MISKDESDPHQLTTREDDINNHIDPGRQPVRQWHLSVRSDMLFIFSVAAPVRSRSAEERRISFELNLCVFH